MAVNPLILSPQVTLSQAANQNLDQMTNASDTKALTRESQTQTQGFNANIGKQNTELQNPKINQDTQLSNLKTPDVSREANTQLKNTPVPEINTDTGNPKRTSDGTDFSFSSALKQQASDYMRGQVKDSKSQEGGNTPSPSETSTQSNYKPVDSLKPPQRPEAQTARVNAPSPRASDTPSAPSYKKPMSNVPPVPKIPKFTKPF